MNREIKRLEYFIPSRKIEAPLGVMMTADEAFVRKSEHGIEPDFTRIENTRRYYELVQGKRWQGIHVHELWEPGILDGSVPYWTLLGGESPDEIIPRHIVTFLKGEIFRGKNKETIEKVYQDVLNHWTWWRRLVYKISHI